MIYFVKLGRDGPVKIGTTVELWRRLKELRAKFGVEIIVLGVRDGGPDAERMHHQKFAHLRLNTRRNKGNLEHFTPAADLMEYIRSECRLPDILDGLKEGVRRKPVRVDLSAKAHRALRLCAADEEVSMAEYARSVIERVLREEANRRGIKA